MIVMINGAFGSGKTTIAEGLARELSNALIFDPEEVGFFLRKVIGPIDPERGDFQHYSMWRILVVETARLLQKEYKKDLIIPITIWRKPYFDEIVSGLKLIDQDFHHFCLTAPVTTIKERLLARGEAPGSWAELQAESCVSAFKSADFEQRIDTSAKDSDEVLQAIRTRLPT